MDRPDLHRRAWRWPVLLIGVVVLALAACKPIGIPKPKTAEAAVVAWRLPAV